MSKVYIVSDVDDFVKEVVDRIKYQQEHTEGDVGIELEMKDALHHCLSLIEVGDTIQDLVEVVREDDPIYNGEYIEHQWNVSSDVASALFGAYFHFKMKPPSFEEYLRTLSKESNYIFPSFSEEEKSNASKEY